MPQAYDVVAYREPGSSGTVRLGVVLDVDPVSATADVVALALERETNLLLHADDGAERRISLSDIDGEPLEHTYAQRMDPDRVSNPHGEHAQETWELDGPLPEGVTV